MGLHGIIQQARKRAGATLRKYPGAVGEFVNVERLAGMAGVDIVEEDFDDERISGFIQRRTKSGRPIIVVNKANADNRQRFTIAHELGHFFLHSAQAVHVDDVDTADLIPYRNQESSKATYLHEIEANQFAAELLMPSDRISADVNAYRAKNMGMSEIVEKLAERYKVSEASMAIRLSKTT